MLNAVKHLAEREQDARFYDNAWPDASLRSA